MCAYNKDRKQGETGHRSIGALTERLQEVTRTFCMDDTSTIN